MGEHKKAVLKYLLVILVIQCLFLFWEHLCGQVYSTTGLQIKDLQNYLSGFPKFDQKCMAWIIIHFPIQFYISLRQLEFFEAFSVFYCIRNGTIRRFLGDYYKLCGKIPMIYYFVGLLTIVLKNAVFMKRIDQMKSILIFCIFCSLILGIISLIFSAFVFLFTICFKRYQIGFCIAFIVEILNIIFLVSHSESVCFLGKYIRIPLCGTIIGFLTNKIWDHEVLIFILAEFLMIVGVNFYIYRLNFEKVCGIEEGQRS